MELLHHTEVDQGPRDIKLEAELVAHFSDQAEDRVLQSTTVGSFRNDPHSDPSPIGREAGMIEFVKRRSG